MVLAERFPGGPDGVQGIALGPGAVGWPLGSGNLDHLLTVLGGKPAIPAPKLPAPSIAQQR
jgi:hypothetical protein